MFHINMKLPFLCIARDAYFPPKSVSKLDLYLPFNPMMTTNTNCVVSLAKPKTHNLYFYETLCTPRLYNGSLQVMITVENKDNIPLYVSTLYCYVEILNDDQQRYQLNYAELPDLDMTQSVYFSAVNAPIKSTRCYLTQQHLIGAFTAEKYTDCVISKSGSSA